jgi:hypothetical protein
MFATPTGFEVLLLQEHVVIWIPVVASDTLEFTSAF